MKKVISAFMFTVIIFALAACNKTVKLADYVDVEFTGYDKVGQATFDIDKEQLYEDVLGVKSEKDLEDEDIQQKIATITSQTSVKLENTNDLENGDTVTIITEVNEDRVDNIEGGKKEITVEGLEELKTLSEEDVLDNIDIEFVGTDGRGFIHIENEFETDSDFSSLTNLEFEVENDGYLENDEEVTIVPNEKDKNNLPTSGYEIDDDFALTVTVEGLKPVASNIDDIENFDEIEEMIDDEINDFYEDNISDVVIVDTVVYDIKKEGYLYRPHRDYDDDATYLNVNEDLGETTLATVYSIQQYADEEKEELTDDFAALRGFKSIEFDENLKIDPSNISLVEDSNNDLEDLINEYEKEGFEFTEK